MFRQGEVSNRMKIIILPTRISSRSDPNCLQCYPDSLAEFLGRCGGRRCESEKGENGKGVRTRNGGMGLWDPDKLGGNRRPCCYPLRVDHVNRRTSIHFIYPAVQNTNAMCTICNLQQSGTTQQGTKCTNNCPELRERKKTTENKIK